MNNKNCGVGFFGLLTIAFVILKLCGIITWSWIWVLAPIWIPWVCGAIIITTILLILGIRLS